MCEIKNIIDKNEVVGEKIAHGGALYLHHCNSVQ